MTMNAKQLRELVVRPTLEYLAPAIPYSKEAEDLLMMTAAHESYLGTYLKQVNGPALGIYQMEPATHDDIWYNFILSRENLKDSVTNLADSYTEYLVENGKSFSKYVNRGLISNLAYATAMARVHYWRVPEPLPKDLRGLAEYAKKYWNTELGKATADDYYNAYNLLVVG